MQYADVIETNFQQYFFNLHLPTYQQTQLTNSPSKAIVVGVRRKKPIL